ncbi:hypothetical protein TNCV_5060971 [Trichonephila clavipes]|nr:hypothetical protein TNCV_5060971 [Trichonephila clavipes]
MYWRHYVIASLAHMENEKLELLTWRVISNVGIVAIVLSRNTNKEQEGKMSSNVEVTSFPRERGDTPEHQVPQANLGETIGTSSNLITTI